MLKNRLSKIILAALAVTCVLMLLLSMGIIHKRGGLMPYKAYYYENGYLDGRGIYSYESVRKYRNTGEDSPEYMYAENMIYKKFLMSDKTFEFTDEILDIKYIKSLNNGYCSYDVYENGMYGATIYFYFPEMMLSDIIFSYDSVFIISEENISSKEQLISVFDSVAGEYIDISSDKVFLSITTGFWDDGSKEKIEDFVLPTEDSDGNHIDAADITYTLSYKLNVDGYNTRSIVSMEIKGDGNLKQFSVSKVKFYEKFIDYDIDSERCDSVIDEKVKALCNGDGFELVSYKKEEWLAVIDNQLCLRADIEPEVIYKSEGKEDYKCEMCGIISLVVPVA